MSMKVARRPAAADGDQKTSTKQHLIDTGIGLLLKHGYNGLGLQPLLAQAGVPKGSFYHHFKDKEDFALQVLDTYMAAVHKGLDASLGDTSRPPLERIRLFFENTRNAYDSEGYLGCLIGGLGQELSGISEVFRRKINGCFSALAERLAGCLEEARLAGDIAADCDTRDLANLLVDCWEGAALRSRLRRSPESLVAMVDFYLGALSRG
jgi:TetR/AcrR family transcriptional repressor of nem operon